MVHAGLEGGRDGFIAVTVVRNLLHDLRSPLVAAQGFLGLLEKAPPGPAAQRYAESLRQSIETMKALLDRTKVACEEREPP